MSWPLADTFLLSLGGGLAPELPPRRGKPQPLLPPLLGPSGGDREPMGLGPPASQLTPPPAPVGLRGSSLRGLPKDSGPLPTPPGVRCHPASSLPPFEVSSAQGPSKTDPPVTGLTSGGAPKGLPHPPESLPESAQPASIWQHGRQGDPGLGRLWERPPPS